MSPIELPLSGAKESAHLDRELRKEQHASELKLSQELHAMELEQRRELHATELRQRRELHAAELQKLRLEQELLSSQTEAIANASLLVTEKSPSAVSAISASLDQFQSPTKLQSLIRQYPRLRQDYLVSIFEGTFDPLDLGHLRYAKSHKGRRLTLDHYDSNRMLWIEGFTTYTCVVCTLYHEDYPDLVPALLCFYNTVMELSLKHKWRSVVNMAISYHKEVIKAGQFHSKEWKIPLGWIDRYCNGNNPSSSSLSADRWNPRRRQASPAKEIACVKRRRTTSTGKYSQENASNSQRKESREGISICHAFNTSSGCKTAVCKSRHQCWVFGCGARHSAVDHVHGEADLVHRGYIKQEAISSPFDTAR